MGPNQACGRDGGWPPSEAMEHLQILDQINQGLSALCSWLEPFWPYPLLLPLLMWALVAGPALARGFWDRILKQPFGDFWPVPAAILPVAIALTKGFDPEGPFGSKGPIVISGLLVAAVFLQVYGQSRNNYYRNQQATRIDSIGAGVESIGARIEQQSSLIAALVDENRKNAAKEEEAERVHDYPPDYSRVTTSEAELAQLEGSVVAGSSLFGSGLAVSPKRDERTIAILKNDQRPYYDQNDEHFLDYFRDDYGDWFNKFVSEIPDLTSYMIGSLATRWPLLTGMIGVGYMFGVDWTRHQESLFIPEEDVCILIDSWMQRLNEDLSSIHDEKTYPCLVHAINSAIRHGLQKSINDLIDGAHSLSD